MRIQIPSYRNDSMLKSSIVYTRDSKLQLALYQKSTKKVRQNCIKMAFVSKRALVVTIAMMVMIMMIVMVMMMMMMMMMMITAVPNKYFDKPLCIYNEFKTPISATKSQRGELLTVA